jgi:hypothetical protein
MKYLFIPLLTLFISIFSTGCSSKVVNQYHVHIDTITYTGGSIAPSSYTIKPLKEESSPNDLYFQRQSHYLSEILNELGYQPASHENLAEEIIYFDYGIEKIKDETITYQEPTFSIGMGWGYHHRPYYSPFWNDLHYTSYQTYQKQYPLFNRYITLLSKDQRGKELWRVDASSVGKSNNLRKIVPLLIKASKPYIGTNHEEEIKLTIAEDLKKKE